AGDPNDPNTKLGTAASPSPPLRHRDAVEHFGEATPRAQRRVRGERARRKEAVLDDLATGLRRRLLAEAFHHEHRDMVAARARRIVENAVQRRRVDEPYVALLDELALERVAHGLAGLDPAA